MQSNFLAESCGRMRAFLAIAVLILSFAGVTAAGAVDAPRDVFTHNVPHGQRVGPIVIYEFQPGVVVRAYWLSPWRNRHYFPFAAAKPNLTPPDDGPPKPAEDFERSWSTPHSSIRALPPHIERRVQLGDGKS
jgi:hypothetical protein